MPNYAFNRLTISGPEELLTDFLERNKGNDQALSFSRVVPYPEEFREMDRAREEYLRDHPGAPSQDIPDGGYNSGGYEWCFLAWGTKWDAVDPWVGPYDAVTGSTTIRFDSAWNAPLPWLKVVAARWPALTFFLQSEDPSLGWGDEVEFRVGHLASHRLRDVEDWVEGPDDDGPIWGPWRDITVDPIWDGWPRPEWTPRRAMALRDAGLGAWILAEKFGLLPDEEGLLFAWLEASHPERIPLLIERWANRGRGPVDDGLASSPLPDGVDSDGPGGPALCEQFECLGISQASCSV